MYAAALATLAGPVVVAVVIVVGPVVTDPKLDMGDCTSAPPVPPTVADPVATAVGAPSSRPCTTAETV